MPLGKHHPAPTWSDSAMYRVFHVQYILDIYCQHKMYGDSNGTYISYNVVKINKTSDIHSDECCYGTLVQIIICASAAVPNFHLNIKD